MSAVLEVRDLKKSFGGIVAVAGVSFDVRQGEILGIIGPNGSGKSTLFNCILGQLRPSGGDVRLDGHAVTGMRPCDLNMLGVSRTFQLLQVFPQLTVRENLILAGQEHRGSMLSRLIGRRDAGLSAAASRMLEFFRLSHLGDEPAGDLSYGQQKLLDVAMAFMAGPAPCAPRRTGGWRQSDHAGGPARPTQGDQRRAGLDVRRHRAQHGIRHGAVQSHPGARGGPHHCRG